MILEINLRKCPKEEKVTVVGECYIIEKRKSELFSYILHPLVKTQKVTTAVILKLEAICEGLMYCRQSFGFQD